MTEGPQLVRSFVAVGAGFFAIQMLGWGADAAFRASAPQSFDVHGRALNASTLLTMLAYAAALEVVGGYVTARLAIRRTTLHAVILGLVVFAMTLPVTVLTWRTTPTWYAVWSLALIWPMTILGATIHEMLSKRGADGGQ